MYLASDPYTGDTVVLDDTWHWAFLDLDAERRTTQHDIILARLADHCASCWTIHANAHLFSHTELPYNKPVPLETGTKIAKEPESYLDLLRWTWHEEYYTKAEQQVVEFWTDVGRRGALTARPRAESEPPPSLASAIEDAHEGIADVAKSHLSQHNRPTPP